MQFPPASAIFLGLAIVALFGVTVGLFLGALSLPFLWAKVAAGSAVALTSAVAFYLLDRRGRKDPR